MADNVCGPSAPTKGLVRHLNSDRNLQQDRMVNTSAGPSSSTFRSTAQSPANAAAGDAAFAAFTANSVSPQALTTHAPPPSRVSPGIIPDARSVRMTPEGRPVHDPHPGLMMPPPGPALHGGLDRAPQANTSWVQDFERMQLETGGRAGAMGSPATFSHQLNSPHMPQVNQVPVASNYAYMGQNDQQMMMAANVGPLGPSRLIHVRPPGFQLNQQAAPAAERFDHYPQTVALAASTEEALDAAFAAYDDDFRTSMDQWVAQHGPDDLDDHDAIMKQMADDLDERRERGDPQVLTQNDPENRAKVKEQEDAELRKYATEILTIMSDGNDKFKKSSFNDLMRRIVNREVVVDGNDLIDVATGEPTDLAARDPSDHPQTEVPPTPTAIIPPSEEDILLRQMAKFEAERAEAEANNGANGLGKGKGKEKEVGPGQQQGGVPSA